MLDSLATIKLGDTRGIFTGLVIAGIPRKSTTPISFEPLYQRLSLPDFLSKPDYSAYQAPTLRGTHPLVAFGIPTSYFGQLTH